MKFTKCITTIGPASHTNVTMCELILNGSNCFRINMSHARQQNALASINSFKKVRQVLNVSLPIMVDLKGPEIRTHFMENNSLKINYKDEVKIFYKEEKLGKRTDDHSVYFSIDYQNLAHTVFINDKILLDDGKLSLIVKEINDEYVLCEAQNYHVINNYRGVTLVGKMLDLTFLSKKDQADVRLAVENKCEYIAASFVQSAKDIEILKTFIKEVNPNSDIKIISKIESQHGIRNIEEIIKVSDALMVARGDLGVDVPLEKIPYYQNQILKKCLSYKKPVIVATQMLESMCKSNIPTRAEVTDVYWAVILGTGATMLSGESANGDFPIPAITYMNKIICEAEKSVNQHALRQTCKIDDLENWDNVKKEINKFLCDDHKKSILINCKEKNVYEIANFFSAFRQQKSCFLITDNIYIYHQLGLLYGIFPIYLEDCSIKTDKKSIVKLIKNYYPYHNEIKDSLYYLDNEKITKII